MKSSAEPGAAGPRTPRRALGVVLPLALAALLALLVWRGREALLGPGLSAAAASPETQVQAALARRDRAVLQGLPGADGRAELSALRYGDVAVQVQGEVAQVLAVVEAKGVVTWRDQRAELGYVGRERFSLARCSAAGWCARGPELPALAGVLAALRGRAEAATPPVRIRAWQIRVERDHATAGEDYDLVLPGGPERRRALHTLRREGDGWVFVEGT